MEKCLAYARKCIFGLLLWIRIRKDEKINPAGSNRWEMEPPTNYSAGLAMSESCHLVVTSALQTWVVFSRSHVGVSLAGREKQRSGTSYAPAQCSGCGNELLQEVVGNS